MYCPVAINCNDSTGPEEGPWVGPQQECQIIGAWQLSDM